jgi:rhodanese-related sulfurtransferase
MTRVTNPQFPEIPVSQLPDEAVLLDVRDDEEWAAGHAPDAVHIPMTTLADRLDEVPDGDPLYVICRTGSRSARVASYLNVNGWDAVNVDGGMMLWERLGRPLVSESAQPPQIL